LTEELGSISSRLANLTTSTSKAATILRAAVDEYFGASKGPVGPFPALDPDTIERRQRERTGTRKLFATGKLFKSILISPKEDAVSVSVKVDYASHVLKRSPFLPLTSSAWLDPEVERAVVAAIRSSVLGQGSG